MSSFFPQVLTFVKWNEGHRGVPVTSIMLFIE